MLLSCKIGAEASPSEALSIEKGQNAPAVCGKRVIPMPNVRLAAIRAPGIQYATKSDFCTERLRGSVGGKIGERRWCYQTSVDKNGVSKPFLEFSRCGQPDQYSLPGPLVNQIVEWVWRAFFTL